MSAICLAQKEAKSPAGARIKEKIWSSNIRPLSSIRRDRTTKDAWHSMLSVLYGWGPEDSSPWALLLMSPCPFSSSLALPVSPAATRRLGATTPLIMPKEKKGEGRGGEERIGEEREHLTCKVMCNAPGQI